MKLKVITHSGIDDSVEVTEYNPKQMILDLNNNEIHTILIGRKIYSRIDIKYISEITAP